MIWNFFIVKLLSQCNLSSFYIVNLDRVIRCHITVLEFLRTVEHFRCSWIKHFFSLCLGWWNGWVHAGLSKRSPTVIWLVGNKKVFGFTNFSTCRRKLHLLASEIRIPCQKFLNEKNMGKNLHGNRSAHQMGWNYTRITTSYVTVFIYSWSIWKMLEIYL